MANLASIMATTHSTSSSLLTSIVTVTITMTSSVSAAANPSSSSSPGSVASPEKCESCDEFTRANLVGVFITLILCLLTQPSGSLYFRGHGGFVWRINPITSFVEASIIFWYLGLAVWEVVVEKKTELRRRRTWRAKASLVLRYMQRMAGALLLIRGQVDEPEGQQSGDDNAAPLLETPLWEGDEERHQDETRTAADSGEVGPQDKASDEEGRDGSEDGIELQETAPTCSGANPDATGPQVAPSQTGESHPTDVPASSFVSSGIRKRSTTSLEANPVPTSPDHGSGEDETNGSDVNTNNEALSSRRRLLRSAFGSNTLTAHRESRIASMTFFSVFVIYVKIFSVSGAAWFKTAVWFSLSGWVAVQMLLILHARRAKVSDQDIAMVLKFAKTIDRDLDFATKRGEKQKGRSGFWAIVYFGMHLPFWAYVSYRMTFGWRQVSIFSPDYVYDGQDGSFLGRVAGVYMSLKVIFGVFATVWLLGRFLVEVVRSVRAVFRLEVTAVGMHMILSVLWAVATLLFFLVWLFGTLDTTTDVVKSWWDSADKAGDTATDRPTIPEAGDLVLKIAWYVGYGSWNIFWILVDIFLLAFLFFYVAGISVLHDGPANNAPGQRVIGKVGISDRLRVAVCNTLFALGIFLWYVHTYDSEGTSKWWLGEYLG